MIDRRPMFEDTDKTYKEIEYFGATAYYEEEYPSIIYAKFGEIYTIENKKCIVLDGAFSIDKDYRLRKGGGYKWFPSEQPTDDMKQYAIDNLKKYNYNINYILSHTCPFGFVPMNSINVIYGGIDMDYSMELWLKDEIYDKVKFDKWYYGHHHIDMQHDKDKRLNLLYHSIIKLGDTLEDAFENKFEYGEVVK